MKQTRPSGNWTPETTRRFEIRRHTVPIPDLPDGFLGMTIVQLSDLHFYEYTCTRYWQQVISAVNEIAPDVVALTGDYIDRGSRHLELGYEVLGQLQASMVKLACLGNHDYLDGYKSKGIQRMLTDAGYYVLINRALPLEKDGGCLWFSGVDDYKKGKPKPDETFSGIVEKAPHITLAHNPRLSKKIFRVTKGMPNLMLSGHTHAGQIRHPVVNWLHGPVLRIPYRYGWFTFGVHQRMYVTSGIKSPCSLFGFPLPPIRIGTLPEIVVFTLTRADGSAG